MAFQLSPGVLVKEVDLTNIVPAVATSVGAIAGVFEKGPVEEIRTISSEEELVKLFGKPNGSNFETFFAASNFLQYGNTLRVVRATTGMLNAMSGGTGLLIKNETHYQDNFSGGEASSGEFGSRTAGTHGNALGVALCAGADAYEQTFSGNANTLGVTTGTPAIGATTVGVDTGGGSAGAGGAAYNVGDIVHFQESNGQEYEVTAISTDNLTIRRKDDPQGRGLTTALAAATNVRRRFRFYDFFSGAPGTSTFAADRNVSTDELHIVVYDATGDISGFRADTAGQRGNAVLETFAFVSQHPNAKTSQGNANFYPDVIFRQSEFIYWLDHPSVLSNAGSVRTSGQAYATGTGTTGELDFALTGGTDDYAATVGELGDAFQRFDDADTVDINLLIGGAMPAGTDGVTHATKLIDIAEKRKDIVAFISPRRADVVNVADSNTATSNIIAFYDQLSSSSYAVFDSGYKYMFDKFNDVFRFIPLNGDIAGLCANTDSVADPFFSPGGFNRGQIRGAVKLAFNPNQTQRDDLYQARINPVVTFPGNGTVLFGDKTALSRPSAFDRINVRRLFILLEKSIATAAKFQLFEFNDEFTQAQFRNLVEPFLRDIQGRRGITDFSVVADGTNNTGEVIDRNEFVADIFIKPARSINFIQLNFVAVRTGVAFSEIGG
jgi:hypothetical protein